jgi:hypothetical protein
LESSSVIFDSQKLHIEQDSCYGNRSLKTSKGIEIAWINSIDVGRYSGDLIEKCLEYMCHAYNAAIDMDIDFETLNYYDFEIGKVITDQVTNKDGFVPPLIEMNFRNEFRFSKGSIPASSIWKSTNPDPDFADKDNLALPYVVFQFAGVPMQTLLSEDWKRIGEVVKKELMYLKLKESSL